MITDARHSVAEDNRKMRPFWRDGRIVRWPARESRLLLVLAEVVRTFAPGKRIPEVEVNEILRQFWPDNCRLRRALVDYELLNRRAGTYWRVG